jgi:hypothetical protein
MELSPPLEAASLSVTEEFQNISWNGKIHYRVHRSLPLVSVLCQINSVHTAHPISLRSILILSFHLP